MEKEVEYVRLVHVHFTRRIYYGAARKNQILNQIVFKVLNIYVHVLLSDRGNFPALVHMLTFDKQVFGF